MTRIHKRELVAYRPAEMYALVNDIQSYPEFLPWCTATHIAEDYGDKLVASLSIAVGKIKHTLTTANSMRQDQEIVMLLVEGPFKQLSGHWTFHENPDGGCDVALDMQFEFKNKLVKHALGAVFHKIVDSLVNAFVERARQVYGGR